MSHEVHIYTDGAAKGNPGNGGYGVVMEWVGKPYQKEFFEGFRLTTNNRMELLAVIVGLEKLKNPNTKVLIVSDSKYVVDSVEKKWVFGWEKKGFVGKKNPDLWKRFLLIYRKHQVGFLLMHFTKKQKQSYYKAFPFFYPLQLSKLSTTFAP